MSDLYPRARKIAEQYAQFKDRTPQEQELYNFARFYLAHNKLVAAQANALNLFADGYTDVDFTEVDEAAEELRGLLDE